MIQIPNWMMKSINKNYNYKKKKNRDSFSNNNNSCIKIVQKNSNMKK